MSKKEIKIVLISAIILISTLSYANSLSNSFVWDDYVLIVENDFVRGFSHLKDIFSKDFFDISGVEFNFKYGYYRPIITLSYGIDYLIWELNSSGFHLTNLILHTLNSILVFFILIKISENNLIPFLASAIFATHPVHTESVTWISGRTDTIACLFFFLSIYSYQKKFSKKGIDLKFYILSILSFLVAILSKEMAMSLPFILMVYDYLFCPTKVYSFRKSIINTIPYFLMIGIYSIIRFGILEIHTMNELDNTPNNTTIYSNILSFFKTIILYLYKLLFPIGLNAYIQNDFSTSIFEPAVFFSLIILFFLLFAAVKYRKTHKLVSFSISFFLLSMLPLSNFIRISGPKDMGFVCAERFLYIPSFALSIALAVLFGKIISSKNTKYLGYMLITILLCSYTGRTIYRNFDWKDTKTLFSKTIKLSPNSSLLNHIMGNELVKEENFDQALKYYNKALELNPYSYASYNNMGVIYFKNGEIEKAINKFDEALAIKPDYIQSYFNLGTLFEQIGLEKEAIEEFNKILKINKLYPKVHNSLGVIYAKKGHLEEAKKEFKLAMELDSDYELASKNLKLLEEKGHNIKDLKKLSK